MPTVDLMELINLNSEDQMKIGVVFMGIGIALVFIGFIERRNETNAQK